MDICNRLREERERLKLSQVALGEIGGIKKLAQINYESGKRTPDAQYLQAISRIGVDVLYVVTGERSTAGVLTSDERQMLDLFRAAPLAVKAAAMGALEAGARPMPARSPKYTVQQTILGDVGQQASGDIINKGKR
jgi:transcriptional regulator with XRE-family HTH domain